MPTRQYKKCSVFNCSTVEGSFYIIPGIKHHLGDDELKLSTDRRKQWISALKLKGGLNKKKTFVCSKHFVSGKPSSNPYNIDWIPTINMGEATVAELCPVTGLFLCSDPLEATGVTKQPTFPINKIKKYLSCLEQPMSSIDIENESQTTVLLDDQFSSVTEQMEQTDHSYSVVHSSSFSHDQMTTIGSDSLTTIQDQFDIQTEQSSLPILTTSTEQTDFNSSSIVASTKNSNDVSKTAIDEAVYEDLRKELQAANTLLSTEKEKTTKLENQLIVRHTLLLSLREMTTRLIYHHLLKCGYEKSANSLVDECPDLKGLKPTSKPFKLPRLLGLSLVDILEDYFETKDYVIEELDSLSSATFRERDSLPTLTKTLFRELKFPAPKVSSCDASSNTEAPVVQQFQKKDASNKTTDKALGRVQGVSVSTEPILNIDEEIYDEVLEDTELHEKITENINNVNKMHKETSNCEFRTQDSVISANIVDETQADPVFESSLQDCMGVDSQDDKSPHLSEDEKPISVYLETQETREMEPFKAATSAGFVTPNNGLRIFDIVTSRNGQVSLVPSMLMSSSVQEPIEKKTKKNTLVNKARSVPVAILPKPIFTTTKSVPGTETVRHEIQHQTQRVVGRDVQNEMKHQQSLEQTKPKPLMKIKRLLRKSNFQKLRGCYRKIPVSHIKPANKVPVKPANNPGTSAMAALMKIAQEECRMFVPELEPMEPETNPGEEPHVRPLNFGKSPEMVLSDKLKGSESPTTQLNRSEEPRDSFLRTVDVHSSPSDVPPTPSDGQIFATTKGKAKRAKRSSPPAHSQSKQAEEIISSILPDWDEQVVVCETTD